MAADKKRRKRTDEKPIREELLDELLAGYEKPEDVIGENGLLKRLTKRVLERAMNAELAGHLGYDKHDPAGYNSGNSRNGTTSKTLKGNFGALELETRIELTENHETFAALGFVKVSEGAHPGYDRTTFITMRKTLG